MVKVTPEMQDEMHRLRTLGLSYNEIGERLGVGCSTAFRHVAPGAKERNAKATREYYEAYPERQKECNQKFRRTHPKYGEKYSLKYYEAHPGWKNDQRHRIRMDVIAFLGGRCSNCGEADWRVLEVNHLDGNGTEDRRKYGATLYAFFNAILSTRRNVEGLNLLCANCNILYEYQKGKRSKDGQGTVLRNRVVSMLGGRCCRCKNNDLRVLVINHVKGGGCAEFKRCHPQDFYRMILSGERTTEDLNVLCSNCNVLHRYEIASHILPLEGKE